MQAGARIEIEEQKEHPMDFALWKAAKPGEPAWESPWGEGRPGWHIECSAMNLAEFGEQIDIHGGGNDLIFPHHENEIAQTEAFTGKPFARFWMHNGMLQLGGEKMSKSLGNIVSIKEFLSKRDGDVMRMLVLNGSYRAPLMFNEETLDAAEKGLERIKSALRPATAKVATASPEALAALQKQTETTREAFVAAMDDDFNTAGALGSLFDLVRAINTARDAGAGAEQLKPAQEALRSLAAVFGLRLTEKTGSEGADKFINLLLEVRAEARKQKQWPLSDLIRDRLKELGVIVEDGKEGATWRYS
jgi:cysteinyl-tRNA synthetase